MRLNKLTDAAILLDCLRREWEALARCESVLELGAGLGWASAVLKSLHPGARVCVSDPLHEPLTIVPHWERLFDARIDQALVGASHALPLADASFDGIFCFAAAHQFREPRATLREIRRVLRPGGAALYLFEPCSPRLLRGWARRRRFGRYSDEPTDVLVPREVLDHARAVGLEASHRPVATLRNRGPLETVYYGVLRAAPFLQGLLPCSGSFRFHKP